MSGTDPDALALVAQWAKAPGRSAIFDFNGTLSDDEPILLRLYIEMFAQRLGWTLTPQRYYQRLAGRSDREIVQIVLAETGNDPALLEDLLTERRARYCALVEQCSPIQPGTVAAVQLLTAAGVPVAISTGAQRVDVDFVLAHSPLHGAFAAIVTEEDVQRGKPDPQGYQLAADALGVDPGDALAFEDSVFGVRSAIAAGMRCIAIEGTRSRAELIGEADAVVAAISAELFAALT
jgi:beta-phosphoglucomutase